MAAEAFDQGVLQAGDHIVGQVVNVEGVQLLVQQQVEQLGGREQRRERHHDERREVSGPLAEAAAQLVAA